MKLTQKLASNFIEIGNDFINLHNDKNLTHKNLNFRESGIENTTDCGTIACHGGWGYALYHKNYDLNKMLWAYDIFGEGADDIAHKLGFQDKMDFEYWAMKNKALWGNKFGNLMFSCSGYLAFGIHHTGICTLQDIGNHYIAVGKRIRKRLEK